MFIIRPLIQRSKVVLHTNFSYVFYTKDLGNSFDVIWIVREIHLPGTLNEFKWITVLFFLDFPRLGVLSRDERRINVSSRVIKIVKVIKLLHLNYYSTCTYYLRIFKCGICCLTALNKSLAHSAAGVWDMLSFLRQTKFLTQGSALVKVMYSNKWSVMLPQYARFIHRILGIPESRSMAVQSSTQRHLLSFSLTSTLECNSFNWSKIEQ